MNYLLLASTIPPEKNKLSKLSIWFRVALENLSKLKTKTSKQYLQHYTIFFLYML